MHLDQQAEVRAERFPHPADVANDVVFVLAMDEARHGPGNGSHFSAVKPASLTFSARSRFSSMVSVPEDQPLA